MTTLENAPLTAVPVHVPDSVLEDLRRRLRDTRWSEDQADDDYYGVTRSELRRLAEYWADGFDWRAAEARINAFEHYRVDVRGIPVHFMRKAGVGPTPLPLILTHGWPWTFWHWSKVIDQLADPGAHGGSPEDAFDVIVPSFPGFGFSSPLPADEPMNFWKTADLWHDLMTEVLGYRYYGAAGADLGGLVSGQLGHKYADEVVAVHIGSPLPLDMFSSDRAWDITLGQTVPDGTPAPIRDQYVAVLKKFAPHMAVHMLDSGTLGHALADSPVGMLAWLLERWANWSDSDDDLSAVFSDDDILTHATIYWATNTIASSMRSYADSNRYPWVPSHDRRPVVEAPTGLTFVGYENPPGVSTEMRVDAFLASDRAPWFNHVNVTAHPRGGHFIPWEVPDEWVDDLRRTFRGRRAPSTTRTGESRTT